MKKIVIVALIILVIVLLIAAPVLARAGGGGGKGKAGLLSLILYPFFVIYGAIVTYLANRNNRRCKHLMGIIAMNEKYWDHDVVKARVKHVFFKVQEAWMERDQNIAKDCMSPALYKTHKTQTDAMIKKRQQNILENINLAEAKVVSVMDYEDDSKDSMVVYVAGSMTDYTVHTETGNMIDEKMDKKPEAFRELWTFIRHKDKWVLDEIDQSAGIGDLSEMELFSEEQRKKPVKRGKKKK